MTYGSRMSVPSSETITTTETTIATTYGHFGLSICSGGTVGGAGAIGTSGWDAVMELRTRERRSAQRTGAPAAVAGASRPAPGQPGGRRWLLAGSRRRHQLRVDHEALGRAADGVAGEDGQLAARVLVLDPEGGVGDDLGASHVVRV